MRLNIFPSQIISLILIATLILGMISELQNQSESLVNDAIDSLGFDAISPGFDILPEASDAPIATPVAFKIAQEEDEDPNSISQQLVENMDFSEYESIGYVESHGPYINIYATNEWYSSVINRAMSGQYGKDLTTNPKEMSIEHTSVNPTGPLHIGRVRNSILGDTLANLLQFAGHDVSRDYYVNNAGLQVAMLVWGFNNYSENELPEPSTDNMDSKLVRYYRKANNNLDDDILKKVQKKESISQNHQAEKEVIDILHGIEEGNSEVLDNVNDVVNDMLDAQVESLESLDVGFDNFTYETEYMATERMSGLLKQLKDLDTSVKKDGAWVIELEEQDFVFQRSNGTTLYGTRDIMYHIDKIDQYDSSIIVLGEDQEMQASSVHSVIENLGYDSDSLSAVHHAFVNTPEGGMSTRLGEGDFLYDVLHRSKKKAREATKKELDSGTLEDIAIGSLRYNIISKSRNQLVTFDADKAVSVKSQTGASVQYAYARLSGIKGQVNMDVIDNIQQIELEEDSAISLAQKLATFPTKIQDSIDKYEPQVLAVYAEELKEHINQFYKDCPVSNAESEKLKESRMGLVVASMEVLENTMNILGMPVVENM